MQKILNKIIFKNCKKYFIFLLIIFWLFSLTSCWEEIDSNENEKYKIKVETTENNKIKFICEKMKFTWENTYFYLKLHIFWANWDISIDEVEECHNLLTIEDYDLYNIAFNSIISTKVLNNIYYVILDIETLDIIVYKWSLLWTKNPSDINYKEFKRFNFDTDWNYIEK